MGSLLAAIEKVTGQEFLTNLSPAGGGILPRSMPTPASRGGCLIGRQI